MTTAVTFPRRFADTCDCQWAKECPEFHDRLIRFEAEDSVDMGLLLLRIVSLGDDNGSVPELGNDPGAFQRFVAEHNWRDPISMWSLAESVTWVSNKYWEGVGARDRSGVTA